MKSVKYEKGCTDTKKYVEYLLTNYNVLIKDIEQMKLSLDYFNLNDDEKNSENIDFIPSTVYTNVINRKTILDETKLKNMIDACEVEINKLNCALKCLPKEIYKIIKDIYFDNYTWEQTSQRQYMSLTSLNKHRKKAIENLARSFDLGKDDYDIELRENVR